MQNFSADLAGIYLGPGSSSCTIVGAANGTNVLDQGIGNIIVGANNTKGNPLNVADAMQHKRDLIKWLRQP